MRRTRGNRRSEDLENHLDSLEGVYSKNQRKHRTRTFATLIGLLLLAGVLGVIYLIYTTAVSDSGSSDEPAKVTVAEGDTLAIVADKLQEAGAIESAPAFKIEARLAGGGTLIKPGDYTFEPGTEGDEIMAELTSNKPPPTFILTIPEGLTIEQTAKKVSEQSNIEAGKFDAAARETDYGYAFLNKEEIKTTEGYLFPKKYEFEKGSGASQVVNRMLEQYLIETQSLDFSEADNRPKLSEYELVTVASLIEREAANPEERPLVASVIYNRLKQDMPLQIDATIQYARGKPKERLSLQDLEIESPYNTYENSGLPPGPIASPSLASLKAAAEPAETDYLYYVLKKDGNEHFFTNDYDKFLEAKEKAGL
ncbi:MAG: endolytic transglycosylase MltG [Rubrobacteraceae bacterium]